MVLNNLKTIAKFDKGKFLHHISGFSDQCHDAVTITKSCTSQLKLKKIQNIVILGMGGSAIGGDLLKTFLLNKLQLPIIVNRSYTLPYFVNDKSLVFAVSYSGNTEETLSSFKEALKREAKVVAITSGGRMAFLANRQKIPLVKIPPGLPPRAALGYLFLPMLLLLEKWDIIENQTLGIFEAINAIQKHEEMYKSEISVPGNRAKEIAIKIHKKIPLIIGIEGMTDSIALRWKCQLNENSKNMALIQLFPELSHNDVEGWKGTGKLSKNLIGLFLRSSSEKEDTLNRITTIKSFLSDHVSDVIDIKEHSNSHLTEILSLCFLGDYVSFYLSVLNKVDPTPVSHIDSLKEKLKDYKRKALKRNPR